MSPDAAIASLDRQLAKHGQDAVLRRRHQDGAQMSNIDVSARVSFRGYRPDEIAGGIYQGDSEVVLSATQLKAEGWPSGEWEVPKVGDQIIVAGRARSILAVAPIYIGSALVRIDLQVRG